MEYQVTYIFSYIPPIDFEWLTPIWEMYHAWRGSKEGNVVNGEKKNKQKHSFFYGAS